MDYELRLVLISAFFLGIVQTDMFQNIPDECRDEIGGGLTVLDTSQYDLVGQLSWNSSGYDFPLLQDEYYLCHREDNTTQLWVCNPDDGLTENEGIELVTI